MAELLKVTDGPPIPAYGIEDVFTHKNKHYLNISLANHQFGLPLVYVPQHDVAIAWFNPSPLVNPQIDEAATLALVDMVKANPTSHFFYTDSSKSKHYNERAAQILDIPITLIPSGEDQEDVIARSGSSQIQSYIPVTTKPKFMGTPKNLDLSVILNSPVGLLDDVTTTGETLKAMLNSLGLSEGNEYTQFVMAVERPLTDSFLLELPPRMIAAFVLPEFIKPGDLGLESGNLYSVERRNEIPPALVSGQF